MHIWLWEYAFLVMLGYGRDESAPTPGGVFATNFVGVRGYIAGYSQPISGCSPRICGMFATCSFSVCYIFALQKYGFCRAKVWFLTCKKGVFELQKYGFCFLNVALLQFVRHVFAECPPHCCNPFATFSHLISSVVAICLQLKSLNFLCV